ncbi:hypothetical protein D3C76_1420570 [compost metagenome]
MVRVRGIVQGAAYCPWFVLPHVRKLFPGSPECGRQAVRRSQGAGVQQVQANPQAAAAGGDAQYPVGAAAVLEQLLDGAGGGGADGSG